MRRSSQIRLLAPILVLATAWLVGCAAETPAPRTVLARSQPGLVVVLPLNVTSALAPELEISAAPVWEALRDHLRDRADRLKTLGRNDARQMWLASIQAARAAQPGPRTGFNASAREFAARLSQHAEFSSVVVPALFVVGVDVSDGVARWDGIERSLELANPDRLREEIRLEGRVPAASLHVVVLDAEGEVLREAQTGLDLLVRARVTRGGGFELVARTDVVADREALRDAVDRALEPFPVARAREGGID